MILTKPQRSQPPQISVMVASYQFADYLEECLLSLVNQTLPPYEIIVCDDASTDSSRAIIERLAQEHRVIRPFFHDTNQGMLANAMFGVSKIRGQYLYLVDGDDRFHPKKLALESRALNRIPGSKVAYSNVRTIDSVSKSTGYWYRDKGPKPPSGRLLARVFAKVVFPNHRALFSTPLISRDAFEAVGGHRPEMDIFSDWDLKIRLAAHSPIVYTEATLNDYRVHDGGIHNSPLQRKLVSMKKVIASNRSRLDQLPVYEREWALRQAQGLVDAMEERMREREKERADAEPSLTTGAGSPS